MNRTHEFSPDRVHRYTLWREWGVGVLPLLDLGNRRDADQFVQFIGLNPSTADETKDDPTVRRCIGYAKAWGFGAMCMTNLFAFRATDPRDMIGREDAIGLLNIHWIIEVAKGASLIIAAWGTHGTYGGQDEVVLDHLDNAGLLPKVHCLARTKEGIPGHPLYLRKDLMPQPLFKPIAEELHQ